MNRSKEKQLTRNTEPDKGNEKETNQKEHATNINKYKLLRQQQLKINKGEKKYKKERTRNIRARQDE